LIVGIDEFLEQDRFGTVIRQRVIKTLGDKPLQRLAMLTTFPTRSELTRWLKSSKFKSISSTPALSLAAK